VSPRVDVFSIIVGVAVGLAAGYLGAIMVLEQMALVGDALSHVALPGLALGILYGFNPFFGTFVSLRLSPDHLVHPKVH
jgi:ABC-type Mn2+/Zn2+ transport system permease subunit